MNAYTLTIRGATVSVCVETEEPNGRTRYRWRVKGEVDGEEFEATGNDLRSGCQGGTAREGVESLCSFLSAWGESLCHWSGIESEMPENADLFDWRNRAFRSWAEMYGEEVGLAGADLRGEFDSNS